MCNQKWRTNWRDASQYNFEKASPVQLAWEFLRRNPDYQQDFETLTTLFNCERGICKPRKEKHEEAVSKLYEFYEKYHLKDGVFPPSPDDAYTPDLSFKAGWLPSYAQYEQHLEQMGRDQCAVYPRSPEELVVRIDLRIPAKALLHKIEALIKENAAEYQQSKRMRAVSYPNYLRLLDAEFDGALPKEMAQAIYPEKGNAYPDYRGNNSVRDALEAAKLLRDKDYYFIQFIEG